MRWRGEGVGGQRKGRVWKNEGGGGERRDKMERGGRRWSGEEGMEEARKVEQEEEAGSLIVVFRVNTSSPAVRGASTLRKISQHNTFTEEEGKGGPSPLLLAFLVDNPFWHKGVRVEKGSEHLHYYR